MNSEHIHNMATKKTTIKKSVKKSVIKTSKSAAARKTAIKKPAATKKSAAKKNINTKKVVKKVVKKKSTAKPRGKLAKMYQQAELLVDKGRARGYVTYSEILKEFPEIEKRISEIKSRRSASQPIKSKTGGSTFANPSCEELTKAGLSDELRVWQLIDQVGGRGLTIGGAQMSEKHCNFMINRGTATAQDLEDLGEEIRRRVQEQTGIMLRWEIRRVGVALNEG